MNPTHSVIKGPPCNMNMTAEMSNSVYKKKKTHGKAYPQWAYWYCDLGVFSLPLPHGLTQAIQSLKSRAPIYMCILCPSLNAHIALK